MEPEFLGLGCSIPPGSWLDVRVFYVRVSGCSLEDAPEALTIRYPPRTVGCSFEVNGNRVSPSEKVALTLRRDRVDTESAEATYVSTDRLRTTGSLPFEVCEGEDFLISGSVANSDGWPDAQGYGRLGGVGMLTKSCKDRWFMECRCAISSAGCSFLKGSGEFVNTGLTSPLMEVYIAGRYSGSPVVLTQTVQLVARRKRGRRRTLDAIPEVDEFDRTNNSSSLDHIASQVQEHTFYQEVDHKPEHVLRLYEPGGYMEGDDGEITWFNAGVRVGVGIGLGMCVGIGIGVGLLMRTYQATTRTLRRRFW